MFSILSEILKVEDILSEIIEEECNTHLSTDSINLRFLSELLNRGISCTQSSICCDFYLKEIQYKGEILQVRSKCKLGISNSERIIITVFESSNSLSIAERLDVDDYFVELPDHYSRRLVGNIDKIIKMFMEIVDTSILKIDNDEKIVIFKKLMPTTAGYFMDYVDGGEFFE